jgi:MinD superfamily P-loop ATPase
VDTSLLPSGPERTLEGWPDWSILIVDDEQGMLNFLVKTLAPRCHFVMSATSAEDGAQWLRGHHVDLVILDMEAGIEHLGRGTTKGVDVMIAVVEPGLRSVETLERIKKLAKDLGIERVMAVINKAPEEQAKIKEKLAEMNVPVLGMIPFDRNFMEADLAGKSPLDVGGPGIEAIKEIKVKLEELFGKMAKEEAAKGGKVV